MPKKPIKKVVRARAKCASFDIEVTAEISTKGLVPDEIRDIQRKLKDQLAKSISVLPFAHVYPSEVRVR